MRNAPDVSIVADGITVFFNGSWLGFAGTSAAAPLWAGFMALANEQAAALGRPRVGFANPALWAIGRSGACPTCFHDITIGNNFNSTNPNLYSAVAGYDLCTGWGSPNGQDLIDALVGYGSRNVREADKGGVSTLDFRPWDQPQLKNGAIITFAQPFSAAPGLPVGLTEIDIDRNANIRIGTSTASVTKERFQVNIDSWADTVLYSGGCAWIEIAPEHNDVQWGQFNTQEDHPWDQPQASTTKQITFLRPYAAPPQVVVWLNGLDMSNSANWRVNAYATGISPTGFTLHIDTWADSVLYAAGVTWIAYSADNPTIASGTFNTQDVRPSNQPQLLNSKTIGFPHIFGTTPQVTVALNSIDIDHAHNLRIAVTASSVTPTGMTWHLDSWADTILYSAGGAYIAQ